MSSVNNTPNTNITVLSQAMLTRRLRLGGNAECQRCKVILDVGEKIASRRTRNQKWYHYECARLVNLC